MLIQVEYIPLTSEKEHNHKDRVENGFLRVANWTRKNPKHKVVLSGTGLTYATDFDPIHGRTVVVLATMLHPKSKSKLITPLLSVKEISPTNPRDIIHMWIQQQKLLSNHLVNDNLSIYLRATQVRHLKDLTIKGQDLIKSINNL